MLKDKDKSVNVRIPKSQYDMLLSAANARDLTVSQVIREAIREKLKISVSGKTKK